MAGLEVIGGISAVIGILDASIKVYNGARKDLKLSETFKAVGRQLPIILDTLQTCKNHLEASAGALAADVCEALEKILEACDEKAGDLKQIFEKVIPGENDTWEKRYMKFLRRPGKGAKVEELIVLITQDVQLIVNHHAVKSTSPERNAELENIIKEMKSIKSSVPEEGSLGTAFNSGGGAQTNNLNYSGTQLNYNAPIQNQNNYSGKVLPQ